MKKLVFALIFGISLWGILATASPREALPSLSEADGTVLVQCPGDVLMKAGFDEKDEHYGLMYFGPFTLVDDKPVVAYPHVWIRFEGEKVVNILLVLTKDKMDTIDMPDLIKMFPTMCDLIRNTA